MNDSAMAAEPNENERNTLLIAYILYCATVVTGVACIAGVIVSHIKINETGNEFLRSHYRWLIRTFWFSLLWWAISGALVGTFVLAILGGIGFCISAVWFLYRVIRGLISFSERRAMPV